MQPTKSNNYTNISSRWNCIKLDLKFKIMIAMIILFAYLGLTIKILCEQRQIKCYLKDSIVRFCKFGIKNKFWKNQILTVNLKYHLHWKFNIMFDNANQWHDIKNNLQVNTCLAMWRLNSYELAYYCINHIHNCYYPIHFDLSVDKVNEYPWYLLRGKGEIKALAKCYKFGRQSVDEIHEELVLVVSQLPLALLPLSSHQWQPLLTF